MRKISAFILLVCLATVVVAAEQPKPTDPQAAKPNYPVQQLTVKLSSTCGKTDDVRAILESRGFEPLLRGSNAAEKGIDILLLSNLDDSDFAVVQLVTDGTMDFACLLMVGRGVVYNKQQLEQIFAKNLGKPT